MFHSKRVKSCMEWQSRVGYEENVIFKKCIEQNYSLSQPSNASKETFSQFIINTVLKNFFKCKKVGIE